MVCCRWFGLAFASARSIKTQDINASKLSSRGAASRRRARSNRCSAGQAWSFREQRMFKGSFTALVTPFKDGKVDDVSFARLVEWQIAEGTHGLVPVGTTG